MSDADYDVEGLALHLLRSTQAAALACQDWVGKGDSKGADDAAVKALREVLSEVPGRGTVVIGEGEKDDAPMLFQGEEVGDGAGGAFEIAVDPLEGTSYCAQGMEGAIAVIAAGPPDSLWATSSYYLDKLVVGSGAKGCIDLEASAQDNLEKVADGLGKKVEDLTVVILDKPRHEELIAEVRQAGAHVVAIPDGDVMGSLRALVPGGGADLSMGVGGSPEGVITACAARLLDGDMQARLAPQKDDEKEQLEDDDADLDRVRTLDDLVGSPDCAFVATAVTDTPMLPAPELTPSGWRVRSLVVTPRHAPLFVESLLPRES
ncbi:MAG: class II fructose-bisphosphatase [Actinomycetota bacterium]|nr:class II fructose-bisphosphatase [Actinomycetota bacterium]